MGVNSIVQLNSKFPCRTLQIQLINQYLFKDSLTFPALLFVHGQAAVGKTTILLEYLRITKINYAYINCIECYTSRLLFESILSQLFDQSDIKCDSFMDFIYTLKNASKEGSFLNQPSIIVLDGVENINEVSNGNLLFGFGKLQELTSIFSLSVVFISKLLPEKFNLSVPSIPIYFPQYTRDDLMNIFKNYKPTTCDDRFFENYLQAALTVFLRTTRDFTEMKSLVLNSFTVYCEPVERGDIDSSDVSGLWRLVVPKLKESLNNVYLGVVCRKSDEISHLSDNLTTSKQLCSFDLPYYAKYFLIAAYLASYNSPKHDRRLFLKNHGKNKKKKHFKSKMKEDITNELLGPKLFSFDRLLAIFYAIMEEKASLTVNLMSQIASLVELRLLAKVGDSSLEKPKYKCLVGFQCVDDVAKTLGFNLKKYLLD